MKDNRILPVRSNGSILLLSVDRIGWVEAARNSVRIHLDNESYVFKSSLDQMETLLDGGIFIRIHRRTIVNLHHIRELRHWLRGSYQILLQNGTQLMLSRSYRDHLFELLGTPIG